jgi:hypothetical protein
MKPILTLDKKIYNPHMIECIIPKLYPGIQLSMTDDKTQPNRTTREYLEKIIEIQQIIDAKLIVFK